MARKRIYSLILPAIFMLTGLQFLGAETGRDIMEAVIDNQKADSSAMDIKMTLIDSGGNKSNRRIQTLTMDTEEGTRSITLFMQPANVKNTRFLTIENKDRDNDQWIYLPSLRKVKRIAAGERDGSFMGSDFSYSDMSGRDLDDSNYELIKEETINGRLCWVVESKPKEGKTSAYGKTVSWVDQQTSLTIKVEFYDENGSEKIKELTMEGFQQIGRYWSAKKTTMRSINTNHRTVVEILKIKYDMPINPGYFTTTFLKTGRP